MYSGTFIQPGTASGRSGGIECGRLSGGRSVGSYSWEREQGTGSVSIITGSMPEDQCMAADTGDQVYERSCIFPSRLGKRMSVFRIENVFTKYQKVARISQSATPHSLRHSFATQLLNNGAGIRDVQGLLGHSSIVTTQIYTEVSINRKREELMRYNGRNDLEE